MSLEWDQSQSVELSGSHQLPLISPKQKVGILGAGIGGLYAALILDSLDIEYEILEASDRTGGRISTYKFHGGGKYDYFDEGAMRFPFPTRDSHGQFDEIMTKRLAELTEYGPLNEGQDRLRDSIIPFYFQARDAAHPGFRYFNGIREPITNAPKGPFGARDMGVGDDYVRVGADAIINGVIQPFLRMLSQDVETGKKDGWETLLAYDPYSLQAYMATKYLPSPQLGLPPKHLPYNVVNWCELVGGSIDDSLVERVLESAALIGKGNNYGELQWKCFEGGTATLPKKIEQYLSKKGGLIRLDKRVTAIYQGHVVIDVPTATPDVEQVPAGAEDLPCDATDPENPIVDGPVRPRQRIKVPSIEVTVNGRETCHYCHVISTLPLPVLRTIDLSCAGLTILQKDALRLQRYTSSVKVAMLFKSNWWTTKLGIVGGQTITDLPIGTIVYPSYGVDSITPSKVLIASYCFEADADRIASLGAPKQREVLKELVLRNLAEVHSGLHPDVTYKYLERQFVDMHVKDWARDEYAMGSVAYFQPGRFQHSYAALSSPAAGRRLHFAGEAMSTHHVWVAGALDGSWRAVHDYLSVTGQDKKMTKFKELWGKNIEWTSKPSPVSSGTA